MNEGLENDLPLNCLPVFPPEKALLRGPPPDPEGPLVLRCCQLGISGGGGSCSYGRPPRSGTYVNNR